MDSLAADMTGFHLWWLGQSGFLLQWHGKRVLIDPYLSDSLTRKYAGTDKPHTRMSERVTDPALLKGITIVTSSHNHTDHLDADTLIPVFANNPQLSFIIPRYHGRLMESNLRLRFILPHVQVIAIWGKSICSMLNPENCSRSLLTKTKKGLHIFCPMGSNSFSFIRVMEFQQTSVKCIPQLPEGLQLA